MSAGEFPHGNEEARALSRPGELAFTGNIDPEGAATLGRDDSSISYLVMRGEQAGSVWLGCAYGLCPLFEVVNDQAAPVGFLRWYSLALDRLVSEPEALTSESAEPLGNPPRDSPAGEVLQPGDEQRLRGRIALADTLVEVEPGDYALTEPIVISRPLTVRAAGTVILRVADVGAAVRVASAGVVLEGLRVCAQAAAPGAGVGVEVVDGASVHVVSLSASGLALALRVDARAALRAEGIEVTGCLEGIVAQGELELDDSQLTSCEVGIVLRAQAKAHIRRCTLRNCLNTAVKIESGCCSLINNRIEGSGRDGIELAGGRLTADRNEVTGTGGVGVLVAGGRAIVRSNVISRAYVGISARCFLLATNNLITQAQVGIQGEQGLVLERSRVRGNVVHGCGYDGIDLRSGDFDLAFNQVGWNRQTGLSLREEGSALLSVIVRDNVLYFHALDGAHVEMESDGLPALLEYNSAFENLRSGYRVSGTSIVIFTRNSASHNQRAGFSIESQAYAALFEDETTSSGLFGIVVWGEAGFGAHRTRHTRDGLAALGSFGTRSSARDEVVEPSTLPTWCTFPRSGRSNGRRSNVSAEVAAAASKPRTLTLERAELLERYAQEPGFARTRTAWEGDHPLR
ncbi:MAG: right-handed parallel beta-helix repeat-containing protein, partial [Myxococcales bacterium]|nr:right-handed parallel beta-helix repeat-containing protein [Myxococcales bacterium]